MLLMFADIGELQLHIAWMKNKHDGPSHKGLFAITSFVGQEGVSLRNKKKEKKKKFDHIKPVGYSISLYKAQIGIYRNQITKILKKLIFIISTFNYYLCQSRWSLRQKIDHLSKFLLTYL